MMERSIGVDKETHFDFLGRVIRTLHPMKLYKVHSSHDLEIIQNVVYRIGRVYRIVRRGKYYDKLSYVEVSKTRIATCQAFCFPYLDTIQDLNVFEINDFAYKMLICPT